MPCCLKTDADDCPKCYGDPSKYMALPACKQCEYRDSCGLFVRTEPEMERRIGGVSFERYSYSEEIADKPDDRKHEEKTDSEVLRIMEFLLDVDNYSAELVSEVLHGNCSSSSDLAKHFGVSRQAIHRKLVDCCTRHPELRKLFITRLTRCRRILTDSERIKKQDERLLERKREDGQMEFDF